MGGSIARGAGGGDRDASLPEATAEAEARHWRAVAMEREAALRTLKRRPLVRLAVGLDWRIAPVARRLRSSSARLRAASDKSLVALAALPSRAARRRRRAALSRQLGHGEPASVARQVSVLTPEGWVGGAWRDATGLSPEVVAVGRPGSPPGADGDIRVEGEGRSPAAALALAASAATGDLLCFVPAPVDTLSTGWLACLAAAIGGDVVAATPTLVHPARRGWRAGEHDLLVRTEGLEIDVDLGGVPVAVARGAGTPVDAHRPAAEVVAAPLRCLVVDRAAYVAAGGLEAAEDDDDVAAIDLCARLRERGGRVVHVPGAVVFDDRPVASRASLRRPIDPTGRAWRWLVERHGPALVRAARPPTVGASARWVVTTGAPSTRVADRWGDWHLAEAMARSLRGLGQDVAVQTADQADSLAARSADIHLVLHGLASVRRTPGQRHILWVISHPESVDLAECDAADLVLVASSRFAASLRGRTSTPVEVLLQATDADRFRPQPPDPAHRHPVTIVAKTRDVMRGVVADALEAGIHPSIYGGGWHGLVDSALIVSDHVPNDVLPDVYSSAGVVLNDHWDTMRAWGFVSNRIFDVLACGAPVISDDVSEVHDLFGEAVPTYRSSAELGDLVRHALEDPDGARARAAGGRAIVLAHHTFDHRAREVLELLEHHGLLGAAAP
jgi:glycosyltransferase involved in cell wall biosynthesis